MNYEVESETGLKLTVSDQGAEMQSIRYGGTEYLWQADPRYWDEHAPVLFPYVGRFTEGKYRIGEKEYGMKIHGFASVSRFEAEKTAENAVSLTLRDSVDTREQYPFRFLFRVTYSVSGQTVTVRYEVENPSDADSTLYFGIGGHPGLNVPLEKNLEFTDYYLEFGDRCQPDRVGFTPACFLAGEAKLYPLEGGRIIRLRHDLFDDDAVVLRNVADSVTLKSDRGSRSVTVRYPGLPYLGFWHRPKTDAPYVCIEPWRSLPSRQGVVEDLRFKHDLVRLPNGESWKTEWSITVQ